VYMPFSMDYDTAKRMLAYRDPGIVGYDAAIGAITTAQRRYVFYVANTFFLTDIAAANGGLFTTRTVHELLWGYNDPLLALRGIRFPGWSTNQTSQEEAWASNFAKPNVKFTGSSDESLLGAWKVVSNQSSLTDIRLFPGKQPVCTIPPPGVPTARPGYSPTCALWTNPELLTGSRDGSSNGPFKEDTTPSVMKIYISEAVRVVNFLYRGAATVKGITMHNYTIDNNALLSAANNPLNANYFMNDPDLIIPLNRYWGGVDLFLSLPHYLSASAGLYANLTTGFDPSLLAPDYSKHQAYILSEPLTGATMSVHKRLMLGVKLSALRHCAMETSSSILEGDFYRKIWHSGISTIIYLPTLWVDEHGEISDSDADSFKTKVYQTRTMAKGIQIGFVIFGGLALVVIALFFYRKSKSTST